MIFTIYLIEIEFYKIPINKSISFVSWSYSYRWLYEFSNLDSAQDQWPI